MSAPYLPHACFGLLFLLFFNRPRTLKTRPDALFRRETVAPPSVLQKSRIYPRITTTTIHESCYNTQNGRARGFFSFRHNEPTFSRAHTIPLYVYYTARKNIRITLWVPRSFHAYRFLWVGGGPRRGPYFNEQMNRVRFNKLSDSPARPRVIQYYYYYRCTYMSSFFFFVIIFHSPALGATITTTATTMAIRLLSYYRYIREITPDGAQ